MKDLDEHGTRIGICYIHITMHRLYMYNERRSYTHCFIIHQTQFQTWHVCLCK